MRAAIRLVLRVTASAAGAVVAMAFSFANACDDIGGVPSWQRCETVFGTPAPDWSEVVPLAIGLGVGAVIWYLLGLIPSGKGEEGA